MRARTRTVVLAVLGLALAMASIAAVAMRLARHPVHFAASEHCREGTVYVPGARFTMGGPLERERPQHPAAASAFCIDGVEVTLAMYRRCMAAGACGSPDTEGQCNANPLLHDERVDHPVNCIDWYEAGAYCAWAGGRLPSEEEWELAARGTDGRVHPWGDSPPSARRLNAWGGEHHNPSFEPMPVAYEESDGWRTTAPVGRFPDGASPYGALDMAGNVAEWTTGGIDQYEGPPGAVRATPTQYATRGASFSEYRPPMLHAAARFGHEPHTRVEDVGFRCVFDAP